MLYGKVVRPLRSVNPDKVSGHEPFADNIKSNKQKLRSHVEAVKGQGGYPCRPPEVDLLG